jgi:hypothetical protein
VPIGPGRFKARIKFKYLYFSNLLFYPEKPF